MKLYNFVGARAGDVSVRAFDNQFRVAEFTNDHRWLVSLFSLCQSVAFEGEGGENFLLVQCILFGFNSQLELDD